MTERQMRDALVDLVHALPYVAGMPTDFKEAAPKQEANKLLLTMVNDQVFEITVTLR